MIKRLGRNIGFIALILGVLVGCQSRSIEQASPREPITNISTGIIGNAIEDVSGEDKVSMKQIEEETGDDDNQEPKDEVVEEKEVPLELTISATGDCTLGTDPVLLQYNYPTFMDEFETQKGDTGYFFEKVAPIFKEDDLTIVNLETTLTEATKKASKKYRFKGLPSFTGILTDGYIEAVNLANNHIYDYLKEGYQDTKTNLSEAGIGYFGFQDTWTTTVKGIKIGLAGYTGWEASQKAKNRIKAHIEALKEEGCKLIIVSFHWGVEYTFYPNGTQKTLAHYAIDQGADLILGHHPHVIQGIESYKDRYIVYSLGNFCFGGNLNPKDKDTFIYQQTFTFDESMENYSSKINLIPCRISSVTDRNDFQPTPLEGEEAQCVIERINQYSKEWNLNYSVE